MLNILHISPNFNYTCGVSKYITIILRELVKYPELKIYFITNGGDSLKRLEEISIKPYIMNFGTGIKNIVYIRKNLNELGNFCKSNKIDIIHTHHRYPELLANQLKSKLNIKTVTTVHSLVKGFKFISFKSDKIIAVSKTVEQNLIENFGVKQERIMQLYNPIELYDEEMDSAYELEHLRKYRVILFIGRNHHYKRLDLLLRAFEVLSKKYFDIALLIVSDINMKQRLKISSKIDRVFIFSPKEDVADFYRVSEIVVLPSKIESLPYTMLESGYFKKLFVGSSVGGIKEFLEDEKNGLLFQSGNINSLIEKLEEALSLNLKKRNELINNLYNKVMHLDTSISYVEKLARVYYQLK